MVFFTPKTFFFKCTCCKFLQKTFFGIQTRDPDSAKPVSGPDSVKWLDPDPNSANLDPKPGIQGSGSSQIITDQRLSKAVVTDNSGIAPERFEGGGNPIRHRLRGGVEGGRGFLGAASGARFPAQRRNCDAGQ
jgi:hypothetical protein